MINNSNSNSSYKKHILYVVMGVSGCGKSTIGEGLAKHFNNAVFIEGDKYHPPANIHKMSVLQQPLNDSDREPWLQSLHATALHEFSKHANNEAGCVVIMACSALKHTYRLIISGAIASLQDAEQQLNQQQQQLPFSTIFVYLKAGSKEGMAKRLHERQHHFFKPSLLDSQFATLEEPHSCNEYQVLTVDKIEEKSVTQTLNEVISKL